MSFANGVTLEGHDAIRAFYRPLHAAVDERIEIRFLAMTERHLAAELEVEYPRTNGLRQVPARAAEGGMRGVRRRPPL